MLGVLLGQLLLDPFGQSIVATKRTMDTAGIELDAYIKIL
jgi:hypothetical protein